MRFKSCIPRHPSLISQTGGILMKNPHPPETPITPKNPTHARNQCRNRFPLVLLPKRQTLIQQRMELLPLRLPASFPSPPIIRVFMMYPVRQHPRPIPKAVPILITRRPQLIPHLQHTLLPPAHNPPHHRPARSKPDLPPLQRELQIPHIKRASRPALQLRQFLLLLRRALLAFPLRERGGRAYAAEIDMPDVGARAHENAAHGVFDVLLERDHQVFGAGGGGAVGEGFFVADGREPRGDVLGVRELGGFGAEGLRVAAENGGFPVCMGRGVSGSDEWQVLSVR